VSVVRRKYAYNITISIYIYIWLCLYMCLIWYTLSKSIRIIGACAYWACAIPTALFRWPIIVYSDLPDRARTPADSLPSCSRYIMVPVRLCANSKSVCVCVCLCGGGSGWSGGWVRNRGRRTLMNDLLVHKVINSHPVEHD